MDDITRNYHRGDRYSIEAFVSTPSSSREHARLRIIRCLYRQGPAMSEQLEQRLDMHHQSCSARISELRQLNFLVEVGTGVTSTGSSARIHGLRGIHDAE
jgi:hypothetical protein